MESFVRRIPGIQSVFMFVCLIQGQSLPIYDCHLWRWLLLFCAGPLWP